MKENDFRDEFVKDLKEKGVPVINLKSGTFDAFLEDQNRFIEFKRISIGGPPPYRNRRGIKFGKRQTRIIREMKNKPYVIAFESENENQCHLYSPYQVRTEFEREGRKDRDQAGFWETESYDPFSEPYCKPLTYQELLDIFTVC